MRHLCLVSLALFASACTTSQSAKRAGLTPHMVLRGPADKGAPSTSCPFTACGGNVQEDWTLSESCAAPISMPDPGCPTSTGSVTPSYSGSIKFKSDGTYHRSISVSGPLTLHLPQACVNEACSAVANGLNSSGYYKDVSCSSDGSGGCNCSGKMTGSPQEDEGTYSTSGNNVTTTPYQQYGLPAETDAYCVQSGKISIQINSSGSVLNGTK